METARLMFDDLDDRKVSRTATFVLLPKDENYEKLGAKITTAIRKHIRNAEDSVKRIYLFPFLNLRLKSNHIQSMINSSAYWAVILLFFLGIIVLLIVSFNFINLSIARYMVRTKEIGVRKVLGANQFQLIRQFLGESLLMSFLALPLAVLLYEMIQPVFSASVGNSPSIFYSVQNLDRSILTYPFLLGYLIIAALLTGLFSGIYPALILARLQPTDILKGKMRQGRKKTRGKRVMVVLQFALSILVIILAGLVRNQLEIIVDADFGFSRERIATVQISGLKKDDYNFLKTEIGRYSDVLSVSGSTQIPIIWEDWRHVRFPKQNSEEAIKVGAYGVDTDFVKTMGMEILNGRDFNSTSGDRSSFILNEMAVERLKLKRPIGQQITMDNRTGVVVGVVKDFLFSDIGFEIPPAVLFYNPDDLNIFYVKYDQTVSFPDVYNRIKDLWLEISPDYPFHCQTLDGQFFNLFGTFIRMSNLFKVIGLVAIFYSCLGLLGMCSYMVRQRTKEIGIRRVLGASVLKVVWNLVREFMILVFLSNVIIIPLLIYGWRKVLQTGILFMTNIQPGIILFAFIVSIVSASVTVVSQSWKSANSNPVESLRYE
jgi:ABC-type antimicrobial peptide transport system permease subunit